MILSWRSRFWRFSNSAPALLAPFSPRSGEGSARSERAMPSLSPFSFQVPASGCGLSYRPQLRPQLVIGEFFKQIGEPI